MKNKNIWFYILLFCFIFSFCIAAKAYDTDLWARLIVGKYFFETLSVMKTDVVSYIPTNVWYDHEWGSGVIFYFILHHFKYFGFVYLQIFALFLIYFIITRIINSPLNILFFLFSFMSLSLISAQPVRCQLFTFLFFTVFLYILERERHNNNPRILYILPFLVILWNNIHGGCVAGLALFVFYITGEFLNRKPVKKYFLPFLLSVIFLVINPWGIAYLKYLFTAVTMSRPDIYEWRGLFDIVSKNSYMFYKFFMFIMIFAESFYLLKFRPKFDFTKYIIILSGIILSVLHIKHIPLAVIILTAFCYNDFYAVFNYFTGDIFNKIKYLRYFKDTVISVLILIFLFANPNLYNMKPFVNFQKYPVKAVEFIKTNNIRGNILTDFDTGSFVSYKLYPLNKIYMDGRYEELYFEDTLKDLNNFIMMKKGWENVLIKYPPDIILLKKSYPVISYLKKSPDWTLLFDDNNFNVFVKTNMVKKSYVDVSDNVGYYLNNTFDTNINFRKN